MHSGTAPPLSASPAAVASAFGGVYRRPPTSPLYQMGLVAAAALALMVPLLYLSLVVGVALGTYRLAVGLAAMGRAAETGSGATTGLLLAAITAATGGALIVFLVRPFVVRRVDEEAAVQIDAAGEPVVLAYVGALAAIIGAPIPRRVEVDASANASASMGRGLLGALFGRGLTLRIGLSLVAALDARALAGVIGHELGHCAQGLGMRATLVIRTVNHRLARRVFVRDRFDYELAVAARGGRGAFWWVLAAPALLFQWTARWVLYGLLAVSTMVSAFMLRRMEFNADRVETRVAGSAAFERTQSAIGRLAAAEEHVYASLRRAWAEKRLPNDLPALVVHTSQRLPEDLAAKTAERLEKAGRSLFSTHPTSQARIAAAQREASEGICTLEGPGRMIFRAFDDACKLATYAHYRALLGERVFDAQIIDSRPVQRQQQVVEKSVAALERLFPAGFAADRPIYVEMRALQAPASAREAVARLRDVGPRLAESVDNWKRALKDLEEATERRRGALGARALLDAGIRRFAPAKFRVTGTSREQVRSALHAADATIESVSARLAQYEALPVAFLRDALQLLLVPQAAERIGGADRMAPAADRLLAALACLRDADSPRRRLDDELGALGSMLGAFTVTRGMDEHYASAVVSKVRDVCDAVNRLRLALGHERYPFDHARPNATLADFVHETLPNPSDPRQAGDCAALTLSRLHALHTRVLGHLAALATQVESDLLRRPPNAPAPKPPQSARTSPAP